MALANKLNKNIELEACTFRFEDSKKSTARIVLKKMIPDCLVYTFEASFNGSNLDSLNRHFNEQDYLDLGRDIILASYLTLSWKVEINSDMRLTGMSKKDRSKQED